MGLGSHRDLGGCRHRPERARCGGRQSAVPRAVRIAVPAGRRLGTDLVSAIRFRLGEIVQYLMALTFSHRDQ